MPTTAATAPDPRGPEARRRPLRLRAVEGPPRAARSACATKGADVMGTSHRQKPVKQLVGARARRPARPVQPARRLRGRARQRRHDRVLGRRGLRPGARARAAPQLRRVLQQVRQRSRRARRSSRDPIVVEAEPGDAPRRSPIRGCDVVAWAHNETSTGVMVPVAPPVGARRRARPRSTPPRAPAACPSTSAEADVYYFAPQKCFAADGGLWLALLSPAAQRADRRDRRLATRWIPDFLSLATALDNSAKDQTYNTPAVATLLLLADQLDWMNGNGGLDWCVAAHHASPQLDPLRLGRGRRVRRRRSSPTPRSARWSSARSTSTSPSTPRPSPRRCAPTASSTPSPTASSAATSCASGMFPAIEPDDVPALTALHRLRRARRWHDARPRRREHRRLRHRAAQASTSTSTPRSTRTASTSSSGSATTTAS